MRHLPLLLAVCVSTSCTLGNSIDVCDRRATVERDLNARTEGDQTLHTRNALAPLPEGGAMVVWTSSLDGVSEVRGAYVSPDGTLQKTCDAQEGGEFTFSRPGQNADQAGLYPAPSADELGVIFYRAGEHEIWAAPIKANGCLLSVPLEPQPFLLSQAPVGAAVADPSIAFLGGRTFVVAWSEENPGAIKGRLLARRFRLTEGYPPEFLPTPNGPHGEAADAITPGAPYSNATLLTLPDGAAMVYFDVSFGTARIEMVRLAPDLSLRWGPLLLRDQTMSDALLPEAVRAQLAWAPDSFLVGWLTGDVVLQPVVQGIFVSGDGQYLSAPGAPGGGPFRLSTANGAEESSVSFVGLFDDGFLAAWQESGTSDHPDHSGQGIRAVGFDPSGAVRFANRACGERDFQLNTLTANDQTLPAMTTMPDGSVLAVWVNNGGDTTDRSGTGLKIVDLSMRELFPLR